MRSPQLSFLILSYLWAIDASSWASDFEGLAVRQDPSVTNGVMSSDELGLQEGLSEDLSTLNQAENLLPNYLSSPDGNDTPFANEVPVALGSNSISPGPELTLTATKKDCSSGDNHPPDGDKVRKRKRGRDLLQRGEFCPAPLLNAPTSTNQRPEIEREPIDTPEGQSSTGSEQQESDLLGWPDLFKISTQDGDSPACFEHTRGLLPIGVCDSLGTGPVPSRFDIYERKNPDIIPKTWKFNNCFLSWPGTDQCFPRGAHGLWCCKRYRRKPDGDGPGRADICLPLHIILETNAAGTSDFVDVSHPLLPP